MAWSLVGGLVLAAFCADRAGADERKFMVMLALSSKSASSSDVDYPAANDPPPLNFSEVRNAYFDPADDPNDPTDDYDILSFREYWEEISYGDVTVSGDAFAFINLPWRQYPLGAALPTDEDADLKLVWVDLDNDPTVRQFSYGVGEVFTELEQMYQRTKIWINPDTNQWEAAAAQGLKDGVWTQGERFRDINGSGNYTYVECPDALDHQFSCTESELGIDADDNGQFDCPVCSDDVGGVFPEPFEDFLRVYDPTRAEGERWVILYYADPLESNEVPSWYNPNLYPRASTHGAFGRDFQQQLADYTAVEYVSQNYPGNVVKLVGTVTGSNDAMGRLANGVYDGPDKWTERNETDNATIKLRDTGFSEPGFFTQAPGWLATFWSARYGTAAPGWRSDIPRLEYFDPATPDPSPDGDGTRAFLATQEGVPTIAGGVYPPDDASQGTGNVLPDTATGNPDYDGPVEFDDMASSIYHVSSSGGRWTNGDLRLGEATSPVSFNNFGDTVDGRPGGIPSAGPMASRLFGERGRPAGNQLNLEMLTWRNIPDGGASSTRPFGPLDPGKAIWNSGEFVTTETPNPVTYAEMYAGGFRDLNLDGLIDQGETLPFDTEDDQYSNYAISVFESIRMNGQYPFNRTRLVEDVVEALDPTVDFNQFTAPDGPYAGHIYGTVLVTPQEEEPFNAVGREFAPSLVPIQTEDGTFSFTNLVGSLANMDGETLADPPIKPDYNLEVTTHEYGHTWEGWPDLYDETEFDQGDVVINNPVGRWDLMANNAMVHPAPYLKQNVNIGTGQFNTGSLRQHTPWVSPIDLRTVLTPGQEQTIIIPPCEFTRTDAFYYFDNIATPARRERFYFWVVSDQGFHRSVNIPDEGEDPLPFPHAGVPGFGLLIAHIDLGADEPSDPFPAQNTDSTGSFWTYNMLQADGLEELESNFELDGIGPGDCTVNEDDIGEPNAGDAGDPFPGCANTREWNAGTLPSSMWHDQLESGVEIVDVQAAPPAGRGRAVTFRWDPREVPSLSFVRPPGGESVPCGPPICTGDCEIYRIQYRAFDFFGGTEIEFYRDDDNAGYDGVLLMFDLTSDLPSACSAGATTTRVPKQPGSVENNVPIDVSALDDGQYYFYARLIPSGADPSVSDVYPASANVGNGTLEVNNVDLNTSLVEVWTVFALAGGSPGSEEWQVTGTASGNQQNTAITGVPYTTDDGSVSFTIHSGAVAFGPGDRFTFFTTGFTPYSVSLKIQDGTVLAKPKAIFQPTPATGGAPLTVTFVSTSLDPADEPLDHLWDFGDQTSQQGIDVRVVQHTYTDPGDYIVTLTVTNPQGEEDSTSEVVRVIANQAPVAVVTADPTAGEAPITIEFDGTQSFDPEGSDLTLEWNFGDQSNVVTGTMAEVGTVSHEYQEMGTWTATLTVTDQGGASDSATVSIELTGNTAPAAAFTASPTTGGAPLKVTFDASASSDVDGDPLSFSWDFGDGSGPGDGVIVEHTYLAIGGYTVTLTVSDGEAEGVATGLIQVANQPPVIALDVSPASGSPPLEVTFDASQSYDPEGGPLSFGWLFGDGATASGDSVVKHTYESVGVFTARLTLTDAEGASSTEFRSVSVTVPGNRPPAISLVADTAGGDAPLTVKLDLSATSDPDGDAIMLTLDFGDGNVLVNLLPSSVVSHTYTGPGTYTIVAVGADGAGATSQAEVVITVTGVASTGAPAPGGAAAFPCALGMVQMMAGSLVGLLLMGASMGRWRRK